MKTKRTIVHYDIGMAITSSSSLPSRSINAVKYLVRFGLASSLLVFRGF